MVRLEEGGKGNEEIFESERRPLYTSLSETSDC